MNKKGTNGSRVVNNSFLRILNCGIEFFSNSTVRKGVITLGDQGVVSLTSFLTGVIISRNCTKEEFGLYLLGLSIVAFLISLQNSFISTPYAVNSPSMIGKAHDLYTGSALSHNFIISFFAIICLIVITPILSFSVQFYSLIPVVWALVIVISFILMKEFFRRYFLAGLRIRSLLFFDIGSGVIQIVCLLLFVRFNLLSAQWAYYSIGIASGMPAICWLSLTEQKISIEFKQSIQDFKKNWSLGKWILPSGLMFQVSNQAYPWFLALLNGTELTGVLAACIGVVSLMNPLVIGMGNFLTSKMAHIFINGDIKDLRRIVVKSTLVITSIMILFCFSMFVFGGSLVAWIYGANYSGNGLIVGIIGLSLLSSAFTVPLNCCLYVLQRSNVGFQSNLIALGFTITLGFWLVKSFGLVGVAFSLLLSNVLSSSYKCYLFSRIIRHHDYQC